jgi:WD40 repeat protein
MCVRILPPSDPQTNSDPFGLQERSLNQIKFNKDGDLLFSVAKDKIVCAWWSANGERLGTYQGHQGAIWTVDVSPNTVLLATGSADNTVRLWNIKTGDCVKVWDFPTAVKRVAFSPDGSKLLAVTEKRMGYLGTIAVLDIKYGDGQLGNLEDQADEPSLRITCEDSKATVAGWSFLSKYIIAGHEDGSVSQYDPKVGSLWTGNARTRADILRRPESSWRTSRPTSSTTRSTTSNFPLTARTSLLRLKTSPPR